MDHPGTDQPSCPNPFDLVQSVGLAACLRYGALVGLVFGIAMGTTLALPRMSYFPNDVIMRCFARGIFGGAELGLLFGVVVGGLIAGFARRSLRFQRSGATAGSILGLLIGAVVAALVLMELRSLETSWRERAPYSDSATTTVAAYSLLSASGALTGALFGYVIGTVIRHRTVFLRNALAGISLVAAGGLVCGLCVNLAGFILKHLDPVIERCHHVL
jgi:hypothetical protein